MGAKPKPPPPSAKPTAKPKATKPLQPVPNPLLKADSRWQRTVRYGWDNGGKHGGSKGGR